MKAPSRANVIMSWKFLAVSKYLQIVHKWRLLTLTVVGGDKYLTSNVQIADRQTGEWKYIGKTHRYFTSEHGLRIMAFGVLFDFTGKRLLGALITVRYSFQNDSNGCQGTPMSLRSSLPRPW